MMNTFLDQDFLLNTSVAKELFHNTASKCPIIDYHCHISPKEIYENKKHDNMTQLWLGGDHYKWRLMRAAGIPETYITGDGGDYEKFLNWAKVLNRAIGNPLHQWSHMELQRYFGYTGVLNEHTAIEVWTLCNQMLRQDHFGARGLIEQSNVELICTTDDPVDSLEWHQKLSMDKTFKTRVLPAWRPDNALNIEKEGFLAYLQQLEEAANQRISTFDELKTALKKRMDHFKRHQCKLSDHGLGKVTYAAAEDAEIERIFSERLKGSQLTQLEVTQYQSALMLFFAGFYTENGWSMQLHYGCRRNNNKTMLLKIGPDTGFDCIDDGTSSGDLAMFLGVLEEKGILPRTIIYSLDPNDNAAIDSVCGCFQNDETVCKIQHGSAWWFNDHFMGMTDHLKTLASMGYLAGFIGMLTDSRSFLSFSRHEYFRRILCRVIGDWVDSGMFPNDKETLKGIVEAISYKNAKNYFQF